MPAPFEITGRSFTPRGDFPLPGSAEEHEAFAGLQLDFARQFEEIFPDKHAQRTVVILPSFSMDTDILMKIKGAVHYEERMLCLLMLLRMPRTRVIYITSMPVAESIVDYYLHLLPGITGRHARERLTMLSCHDPSVMALTRKILDRPRLIERIRDHIPDPASAHLTCFNISPLEKTLAVRLGIPIFGTDPDKYYEGTKSGGRKNFRTAGVSFPDGFEDLTTKEEVIRSLALLKRKNPGLRKAVVKVNDGFSGDGNAIYRYPEMPSGSDPETVIRASFSNHFKTVAAGISETEFFGKFASMGGITETFLEGEEITSPSVQCVISPKGKVDIVSTHDQILGGPDNQIYLGAAFPASAAYNVSLAEEGRKIAEVLASKGAMGRFAIDFLSVRQKDGSWVHHAIEINLRKGGTTHPLLMLQFLTDGRYDAGTGAYITASGNRRFYFASDNVTSDAYRGLTPDDLIDIAMYHDIMYDGATQEGVMFHLVGALSEFGKLGLLCVGGSPERAKEFYDRTISILDHECS
jgi:hypothetical protein